MSTLVYIHKWEEEKALSWSKILNNKSKRNDGESPLATIIVIIHSGKKHRWILKLLGENEMRNKILHGLKMFTQKVFINYRGRNKLNL